VKLALMEDPLGSRRYGGVITTFWWIILEKPARRWRL